MSKNESDEYTDEEKNARFEAALRAAVKKPPMHRSTKKEEPSGSSGASEEIAPP